MLYSNENLPKRVVEALPELGHDIFISYEAGRANQMIPDDEVLAFAMKEQRALLTLNCYDLVCLHQQTQGNHSGIIACIRDDANPKGFAERVHAAITKVGIPIGQLIRFVLPST